MKMSRIKKLYLELLVSDTVVGEACRPDDGVTQGVGLLVQPLLGLPHVVEHRPDHGQQHPPDQEGRAAPALLAGVPGHTSGGRTWSRQGASMAF